jgi:hypothetical protein
MDLGSFVGVVFLLIKTLITLYGKMASDLYYES